MKVGEFIDTITGVVVKALERRDTVWGFTSIETEDVVVFGDLETVTKIQPPHRNRNGQLAERKCGDIAVGNPVEEAARKIVKAYLR